MVQTVTNTLAGAFFGTATPNRKPAMNKAEILGTASKLDDDATGLEEDYKNDKEFFDDFAGDVKSYGDW